MCNSVDAVCNQEHVCITLFLVQECDVGSYGFNCNNSCGNCLDNTTCEKIKGKCLNGCEPGWRGDVCLTGKNFHAALFR